MAGRVKRFSGLVFLIVFSGLSFCLFGQFTLEDIKPASKDRLKELDHGCLTIGYDGKHRQAAWVMYLLTGENVKNKVVKRSNRFRKDPLLTVDYALTSDYTNSGYDRGHLCPSDDMCWSRQSMQTTFYMSNISPQSPGLNRGLWKQLENRVRKWAVDNDSIIVLTGAVLDSVLGHIGRNNVSVPSKFYKIVVDISHPTYKAVAFVMENRPLEGGFEEYSCSVDEIERMTGLNFFPAYEDDERIRNLESSRGLDLWDE